LQGLQAIIPFKIDWLNEACMGLGAGFSGQGEICGHVSAGIVAIGLDILSIAPEIGRDTVIMRKEIQRNTRRFCRSFKQEFSGLSCRELVGVDNLLEPELYRKAVETGGMSRCFDYQRWVTMFPLPSEREPKAIPSLEELRGATAGENSQT